VRRRRVVIGFGPSNMKPTANPSLPIPVRLGLRDWSGRVNFGDLQKQLRRIGVRPSEVGLDLLTVALGVYAADLCTSRRHDGDDAWTRHLNVDVEVSDPKFWEPVAEPLAQGLRFLSNDVWTFSFRQRGYSARQLGFDAGNNSRVSRISLFSGGLDSTIGAIDQLATKEPLLLASTSGERTTSSPQKVIYSCLARTTNSPIWHVHQRIQIPRDLRLPGDSSQRSRSFLFIAFGAFLASAFTEPLDLLLPENGLIALNVPVNATRLGANSTKTTHPFFLGRVREVIKNIGLPIRLIEPYRFSTKGEMVAQARGALLDAVLDKTVSCAKAPQLFRQGTNLLHCGSCIACIIRRAAIAIGYNKADPTGYFYVPDLYAGPIDAREHGQDIRALKAASARVAANPELATVDVYRSGPLGDVIDDITSYVDVYGRGMRELHSLLEHVQTASN